MNVFRAAWGIVTGHMVTLKYLFKRKSTIDYPRVPYPHPERFRGAIGFGQGALAKEREQPVAVGFDARFLESLGVR